MSIKVVIPISHTYYLYTAMPSNHPDETDITSLLCCDGVELKTNYQTTTSYMKAVVFEIFLSIWILLFMQNVPENIFDLFQMIYCKKSFDILVKTIIHFY